MNSEPVHRTILALDIEDFTSPQRRDADRLRLREVLYELLERAFSRAAIERTNYQCTDQGDSILFLLNDVPKTRVLPWLILRLAAGLDRHNRTAPEATRLRVRVVVHAGEVTFDGNGYAGKALNLAFRLLDSDLLHDRLASAPGSLALLVSDPIYDDIVQEGFGDLDSGAFQQVEVAGKNTRAQAWVYVPEGRRSRTTGGQPFTGAGRAAPPPRVAIPQELPPDLLDFTGGEQDLEHLLLTLSHRDKTSPTVVAIDGVAGVGKSALAVRAAHRLAHRFPEGQLYVNLQGATAGLRPLDPGEAVGRLLRALGVDGRDIPVEVEEATARFRSLLAGRRILLLLDNAVSAAQVRPLLPATSTCATLITSRQHLSTLGGAEHLHLDVLPPREAVQLLERLAGAKRLAREPPAVAEVARQCAYLPLALRIAGARLAARARWPVRALAERLRDERGRLDELEFADLAVRSCFQVSYQTLKESVDIRDQAAARLFRLLGLHRGPEVGVWAAAALLDAPPEAAEAALERLVDAQLLETHAFGRYRMHDLLLLFARELAAEDEDEAEANAARTRMLHFYLATARRANRLLHPEALEGRLPRVEVAPAPLADRAEALAWFDDERANLLAAAQQAAHGPECLHEIAVGFSWTTFAFFQIRTYWRDQEALAKLAVRAARQRGDQHGEAIGLHNLGSASFRLGRPDQAIRFHEPSCASFRRLGDRAWENYSLTEMAIAYRGQGKLDQAMDYLERSLAGSREVGDRFCEAFTLNILGLAHHGQEQFQEAIGCFRRSLEIHRTIRHLHGQAINLTNLGESHYRAGQVDEAIDLYEHSIRIYRETGDRRRQAETLLRQGYAWDAAGEQRRAQVCHRDAQAIFDNLDVPLPAPDDFELAAQASTFEFI